VETNTTITIRREPSHAACGDIPPGFTLRPTDGNILHWAAYDWDGHRVGGGCDWVTTPTDHENAVWDELAARIAPKLRDVPDIDIYYIRHGAPPAGGKSRNHATGDLESGVSYYAAEASYDNLPDDGPIVYLVTGKHVGYGSDGESLLADVRVISQIEWSKEHSGFICIQNNEEA